MEGKVVDNRYFIGEQVGKGGFSKVYKAYMVPQELLEDACRGQIDTQKLGQCDHVIKVATSPDHDFSHEVCISNNIQGEVLKPISNGKISIEEDKVDYTISKYMKGGDLFSKITKCGLEEIQIKHIFQHLIEGLSVVHQSGYAHMDVKLGNILMDENDIPYFGDFGLAVRVHSEQQLDGKAYCYRGSRKYIAPEILEQRMFSPFKADIFSLGVCLFVMTVGGAPFARAERNDKKYKHLYHSDPMRFWRKHSKAKKKIGVISSDLIDLILSLLNPDPEKRPSLEEIKSHPWMN